MTCIYCGEKTSATGLVRDACGECVDLARERGKYRVCYPFSRRHDDPFRFAGVSWFKWRGQWRVANG